MTKLDIAISSIKSSIEISDEELDNFKELSKSLNEKTNELMMKTGKISDRFLLFMILLINMNKKEKIFNNFEENLIKLLKKVAPLLQNSEVLESQLVLASLILEYETLNIKEDKNSLITDENIIKILEDNKKTNEDTINFINEIIKFVEKLAININKM